MKYVALLSGGKDSCYNLLHCARHGHELVAAATLGPEEGKEELDSYLYQTVGQDAIRFVAQALDVPLYRKTIVGTAVEQGAEYGGRNATDPPVSKDDETEDLYALLAQVKTEHPDIQGVSVGAILSNYQRIRVEHVCRRLSLTPLSYLWQRNQAELLAEMIEAGMESIIIKVAGIGLTTKHLGKTLAQMQPKLTELNSLYGSHICGEGGEYETLTLDCPLFKQRITLLETETIIHSDSDFATVAFLRIKSARLEPKESTQVDITVPDLLEAEFGLINSTWPRTQQQPTAPIEPTPADALPTETRVGAATRRIGNWLALAGIQRSNTGFEVSLEGEVSECFHTLQTRLQEHSLLLSNLAIINIFISSMEFFGPINTVYSTFFGVSPPARACVAVDLPPGVRIRLDCLAYAENQPTDRQSLHVQGLSYWAPANIGPYSQAITVDERIFISGQIGLVPSTLALPSPQSLSLETVLCSQHVHRIVTALRESGGRWKGVAQSAIYWLVRESDISPVMRAHDRIHRKIQLPTLFVVVKELPRGALVEKQVLYHTGRGTTVDEDGEQVTTTLERDAHRASFEGSIHWETCGWETGDGAACAIVYGKGDYTYDFRNVDRHFTHFLKNALSVRLFYKIGTTNCLRVVQKLFGLMEEKPAVTLVPCRHIAAKNMQDCDYAMCIIAC